jgi:predicted RNA binding protein YcfA (HicA-like mRNA interferase family)
MSDHQLFRDAEKALTENGFKQVPKKHGGGSGHIKWYNAATNITVVVSRRMRDKGMFRNVLKQAGIQPR